jgi:hypothetical protein
VAGITKWCFGIPLAVFPAACDAIYGLFIDLLGYCIRVIRLIALQNDTSGFNTTKVFFASMGNLGREA